MKAEIIRPSAALSRYIDSYMLVDIDWRQTSSVSTVWRLIPYGKVSMLFLYGDPHEYSLNGSAEGLQRTRQAFLVGQLTQPIWLKFTGHTRLIKIQFNSSGAQKLLPMNMEEFKNVPSLDLEAVWGNSINRLLEQLHEADTDAAKIHYLNTYLEKRLLPQNDLVDYVDFTIRKMEHEQGNISIKALEQSLGISTRQLERLFRAKIGLSPKEMSKIIRLNSAFSSLETDPCQSMTTLAYQAGYYDQSHFTRDFKGLAGVSPTKLFSQTGNELFVTHGHCFMKQKPRLARKH